MNGWPITTSIPAVLRRPLMWAALCSLLLHVPVLVWFAPWPHAGHQDTSQHTPPLMLALIAEAGPPVSAISAAAVLPASPALSEHDAEQPVSAVAAVQLASAITLTPTAPSILSDAAAPADPAPAMPRLVVPAPIKPQRPLAEQLVTVPDSPVPDRAVSVPLPVEVGPDVNAAQPAVVVMSEAERNGMEGALQALLATLNDAGTLPQTPLQATSLGLLASDTLTLTPLAVQGVDGLQQVEVAITRSNDGRVYQMRARLQERALSYYAKFINRWDNNVMLSNDRVDGRFHANSAVNFEASADARPQFNGEVTLARRQSVASRLRQSAMFAGGLRTGTGRIALPAETLPAHWLTAGATVITLASDARLKFEGDNGVVWSDSNSADTGRLRVPDGGLIIAGTEDAGFELAGTIAGKIVVFSPRQLLITDDLVYASKHADSPDALALVSEGSIEVAPASVTGAGDLEIHGALYARQRFSVRRFRDSHQGTLYVYGALIAGSVSATEPRFYTHIEYDQRFEHRRAPAFPSTGLFDLLTWEQHWTDVTDSDALPAGAADNAGIAAP